MKKMLVIFAAVLLVAGLAGQASAQYTFANGDLIRVVYDTSFNTVTGYPTPGSGSYDVVTDLGSLTTLTGALSTTPGSNSEVVGSSATNDSFLQSFTVNGSNVSPITTTSSLMVAYFVYNPATTTIYSSVSQTPSVTPTQGSRKYTPASGLISTVLADESLYQATNGSGATASSTAVEAQSYTNSWSAHVDEGIVGSLGSFLTTTNAFDTEAIVANLVAAGANGYQYLYAFADGSSSGPGTLVTVDNENLEIFTNANGSTTLEIAPQVAQTPIPPGLLLLAPGLLGLVGIRRRLS
jgi:hypothetical protein